jgi:alpha-D-xyloside xylohydrolase
MPGGHADGRQMQIAKKSGIRLLLNCLPAGMLFLSCAADTDLQRTRDGIIIPVKGTRLKVQVLDPAVIRIANSPGPSFEVHPSLVVNAAKRPLSWDLEQGNGFAVIHTERLRVRISLLDGAIAFYDSAGLALQALAQDPGSFALDTVQGEKSFRITQKFSISPGEGLYGLGQFQDGIMNWRGRDVLLVQANRTAVNPFLVSTRNYGILWDNYSKTRFHDGPDCMSFQSEAADRIDYLFISGENMDGVIAGYRRATGTAPLFPKWAYGYWQSKERYRTRRELLDTAKEFRDRRIPVDALVQDWQYWGGNENWSGMVWTPDRYPDPKTMIDSLHSVYHLRLMNSIWPAVGVSTDLYAELKSGGLVFDKLHWSGGKLYDAYSEEARNIYWKHLNKGLFSVGVDAFWMDATEPELTSSGDPFITETEIKACGRNALGTFSRYLNPYSLMTAEGVYENWRKTAGGKRPFILTRSSFSGQQRYAAATWSGDIGSSWDVLRKQISAGINFCMAGIPYWTTDIGGFLPDSQGGMYPEGGSDPAFQELYVRWFQFGAFCPVFRSHGTGTPREPWRFGEPGSPNYDAIVRFDHLRYRLMPYIYSTAWMVTRDGYTMMRGLPMDFSRDPAVFSLGTEYLFGPSMLVCPVTREMFTRTRKEEDFIPGSNLFTPEGERGSLKVEFHRGIDFKEKVQDLQMVEIALTWFGSVPEPVLESAYSVRWTGEIAADRDGIYRFVIRTDGGCRLFVDGRTLMDSWNHAGPVICRGEISLKGGKRYPVRIEHSQLKPGAANFKLEWIPPKDHVTALSAAMDCYLPRGAEWFDFWTGGTYGGGQSLTRKTPLDIMPLFVKAGSIIPMEPFLEYAEEKPSDPVELRIYPGGDARFELYEDENDNQNYENGIYAVIPLTWEEESRTLIIGKRQGGFPGMLDRRTFQVVCVGENHGTGEGITGKPDRTVLYHGEEIRVQL